MYRKFGIVLALFQLFTVSCWDQEELNDRAIWICSGVDRDANGDIVLSGQILVPSQQGGAGGGSGNGSSSGNNGYMVVSGRGQNVSQAAVNMQGKLSRRVFPSHRRVIVLGEEFAKDGIVNMLDEHSRNPEVRLRTDIFVVKGTTARELLETAYPLEKIPAIGALKELEHTSGMNQLTFMRFLRAASNHGISPVLPVISLDQNEYENQNAMNKQAFQINGLGIFDDELKLKGFIQPEEAIYVNWLTGMLARTTVSALVPNSQDSVSLHLSQNGRKIQSEVKGDKVVMHIQLYGKGVIRENQSRLDLRHPDNVKLVKLALEKEAAKAAKQVIVKMQKKYGEDIFGFGEVLHRSNPQYWKEIMENWNYHFTKAELDVKANFSITQIGLTGPGLHWQEEKKSHDYDQNFFQPSVLDDFFH
ncbi:Ger(x)C family spore germination protein [Paenibacillus sp. WC2504]|uniref:Ger(x)C family spore germination protein n=1 Tax=Paenibacillus sp. WC2504 TaxID=3461403 RepID=UPI004045F812